MSKTIKQFIAVFAVTSLILLTLIFIVNLKRSSYPPPEEIPEQMPLGGAFYTSCFQLQNLSSNQASVILKYYSQTSSSPVATPADTIPALSSKTYCPLSSVPAGFNGSLVIESTQPLASIVNLSGEPSFSGLTASYIGITNSSSSLFLPLLMKENYGYNTFYNIQNIGNASTTASVTYSDGITRSNINLSPGQSVTLFQSKEAHANGWVGSATVTSSSANIAVTVVERGANQLLAYNGFPATSVSANPVMPLVQANNYGYLTGIQLQNTTSVPTNVTLSYTPAGMGSTCNETKTIPAGSSVTFAVNAWSTADQNSDNTCINGETFVGSGKVTANSAGAGLVGIVNQINSTAGKGAAYGAFSPSQATSRLVMPLITDRNYGYFTGFNIQNVGSSTTNVSCTFSNSSVTLPSTSLPPGSALNRVQGPGSGMINLGDGYVGSATCTASGGDQKIIGVVNYLRNSGQDTFMVYEAVNQ